VSAYTIEQGLGVRERMNHLAAVHAPATLTLFDLLGVPARRPTIDQPSPSQARNSST
jgi:hypothetical protein